MPKGLFTQGAAILTERPLAPEAVSSALSAFTVKQHRAAEGPRNWVTGYPTWTIAMRPEVNGYVSVDVIDAPWPDVMGNPKSPDESEKMLFGAWSMGFMGPHTWPGGLERAIQHAPLAGRKGTAEAAARHRAFVRIHSTYVLGNDPNAKVLPPDYQPRAELEFITSVAQAIAKADGALCYFNPGGETLLTAAELDEMLETCRREDLAPLPAWANQRVLRLDDAPAWAFADIIGMGQLDSQDHEAVFEPARVPLGEVVGFLRNTTNYVLDKGPVIKDGHTMDGPGGRWRAFEVEESILPAPRPVLRWFAEAGGNPPPATVPPSLAAAAAQPKRGVFGRLKSMFGGK